MSPLIYAVIALDWHNNELDENGESSYNLYEIYSTLCKFKPCCANEFDLIEKMLDKTDNEPMTKQQNEMLKNFALHGTLTILPQ